MPLKQKPDQNDYVSIPLGRTTWERTIAREPDIKIVNRYFEETPTNLTGNVSMLLRPVLKRRTYVGTGPIRAVYQQDGVFDGDMFVVSGAELWRVAKAPDTADVVTQIVGGIHGDGVPYLTTAYVSGDTEYLWIADGNSLQYYTDGAALLPCPLPDDVSATSLDYIKGYVIVTVGAPFSQRFYWIQPGAITVNPLDFAEAESSLDPVLNVTTIGDQFWLFGTNTTEPWYVTGDAAAPMAPLEGRPFNRGIWPDTAVKVNDSVILVGQDGRVYDVTSGPNPISYPGIEARIQRAMDNQINGINE